MMDQQNYPFKPVETMTPVEMMTELNQLRLRAHVINEIYVENLQLKQILLQMGIVFWNVQNPPNWMKPNDPTSNP